MRRASVLVLACLFAGCGGTPMPPPAAGDHAKEDAMAPADVSAQQAAMPAPSATTAREPLEPVANDLGTRIADAWVGDWQGPEGSSLAIAKQEVGYELVIADLDGPRNFHGIAGDEVIEFERDGRTETLRAGDGKATGMKWLADKRDCLVVKAGEGYCRD